MRNDNPSPNTIYAKHTHNPATTTPVLMNVAEQGLYDYECDANSREERITAKAELTHDELNHLCIPSPNTKPWKDVEDSIIHYIVAKDVARAVSSK